MRKNKENKAPTPVRKSHRPPLKSQLIRLLDAEISRREQQAQANRQSSFGEPNPAEDPVIRRFCELMDLEEQGSISKDNFNHKLLRSLEEFSLLSIFEDLLKGGQELTVVQIQRILTERGCLEAVKQRIVCFM